MRALVLCAALAACGWTPRDATLATVATAALAADWAQTVDITAACQELNPVLGECGERFPVNVYFPLVIVANLAAAHLAGSDWRPVMLGAMAGAELSTVWANWAAE